MDGGSLWAYVFEHFIKYVIGAYIVVKTIHGITQGSTGDIIKGVAYGGLAYWIGKDPGAALEQVSSIIDKAKSISGG